MLLLSTTQAGARPPWFVIHMTSIFAPANMFASWMLAKSIELVKCNADEESEKIDSALSLAYGSAALSFLSFSTCMALLSCQEKNLITVIYLTISVTDAVLTLAAIKTMPGGISQDPSSAFLYGQAILASIMTHVFAAGMPIGFGRART